MSKFIPLSEPNLSHEEIDSVLKALKDGWVSSAGPDVKEFESLVADYLGVENAVACSSGTAALHASLHFCEIHHGHDVILPSLTFVATANAITYTGAKPVFADIEIETLGLDFSKLKNFIKINYKRHSNKFLNRHNGNILRAILPVDMLGCPVNEEGLEDFLNEFPLTVIRDSAEALGSSVNKRMVGNSDYLSCFSFNGNKIITTGGGGMITTNNKEFADQLRHITTTAKSDAVFFNHDKIGFNYRLVNVLASIGIAQIKKLESFIKKKQEIHQIYKDNLHLIDIELFEVPKKVNSNYWLNLITFKEDIIKKEPLEDIVAYFASKRIQVRPLWTPMSMLPMYSNNFSDNLDVTYDLWRRSLCLPSSTGISEEELDSVSRALKKFLEA